MIPETSGVSSPPFDTEIKGQERRRDIAETPKSPKIPTATKKSAQRVLAIRSFFAHDIFG
jgi:hypothetical protein